jgi:lipopolysaccharide/colanic/teichoic acid biosynthesis glycosyltransferase
MKRIFDFVFSLIAIVVLSPLFLILGLVVKLSDGGSVLFIQKRTGRGGVPFNMYKFRSMSQSEPAAAGLFEPGNISRITPTGKFLRKTKLDELPQLFNVLIGDMSFVGPRPEVEKWVAVYPGKWRRILTVRPGITDKASIEFLNEEKILSESSDPENRYLNEILPRKLDLCVQYADDHSFTGDMRIMILTIKTILFR